jgi:hypothetical protein
VLVYVLQIFYRSTLLQILQVTFHSETYLQATVNVYNKFSGLMYVCPCIIYENDESYQLDAQIYLLS